MSLAQFATLAALGITSVAVGFRYGRLSTVSISSTIAHSRGPPEDSDDEAEALLDSDLSAVRAGTFEQCKLVLCVRTDLKMTPGKIAAQCGHATLACYKALSKVNPSLVRHWELTGQAKVALKCPSEEELLLLRAKAQSLNLCAKLVQDAGRTEVDSGSVTVLGIGPGPVDLVNQVTGKLRLL
ncbi:peptidyl-tRNA hydrolase PTH2-domain-containing protein [Gautieria morchelliformis]|nr:peptidyl-tRNA hydrolase PTH2-domain-containing protein [Gautieria morchelliformis]